MFMLIVGLGNPGVEYEWSRHNLGFMLIDKLAAEADVTVKRRECRSLIGSAVIEVTATPHTGCKKFSSRFGVEAMKFVNSPEGKQLHLRGINTRIVQGGTIRAGDVARKV